MKKLIQHHKYVTSLFIGILGVIVAGTSVFAAGNISSTQKYSQFFQQASQNVDLDNNGINDFINWSPTNGGATVTDTNVTGFIWGESVGWINLGPFTATAGPDAGVKNTCSGILSGYAWGQNTGWINFAPTNATGANQPKVNTTTGQITGTVWSQNYGWIQLSSPAVPASDPSAAAGLMTSWHGCVTPPTGGGGGTSGSGSPTITVIVNVVNNITGTLTPQSFTVQVQNNGSTVFGAPFTGSSSGTTVSGITNNTYQVSLLTTQGYTPIFSGACNSSGAVTVTSQQQVCTVTLYDGPTQPNPDFCPNITGTQSSVPTGYTLDAQGKCIPLVYPPTPYDACPNLDGIQTRVPTGYILSQGTCQLPVVNPPATIDICPNITGDQSTLPLGYIINDAGECIHEDRPPVPPSQDKCPNVDGIQFIIPLGFVLDNNNQCVPVSKYVNTPATPSTPSFLPNLKGGVLWPALGALSVLGLLASIPGLISRFGHILLTIVLWKRRRPYGVVYDSVTKEPLDPAYVSVIDMETGKEVTNAFTDIEGRYGFLLKKGTYRIVTQKTHYQFPSQKLFGKMNDEVFEDLYFGEVFHVEGDETVITLNIPMDMIAEDWNQVEKRRRGILEYVTNNHAFWDKLFLVLFVLGFIISVIITYLYPVLWNIIMTLLYIVIDIIQALGYGPVKVGSITERGAPVAHALVRAYHSVLHKEIGHKITNDQGSYFILVPQGDYYLTVETKNPDGTYTKRATSQVIHAKQGVLNTSFTL